MKIGKLRYCIGGLVGLPMVLAAQNPIVQTMYTADPAPMVYDGKLFLYTSHDEDASTWFVMNEWKLYSTTDMVNWTDHGAVLSYETFSWAKGDAWAMQCVERDGKFYAYVPVTMKSGGGAIGVAVADSPYGPFHDPLGKPLAQSKRGDIDPTVFIDDDGQAYLYWGNPFCYYVKLNEDMISYSGEIMELPHIEDYQEGPWFYKRNGHYYLAFASTCCPEGIGYAMSKNPLGPWEYKGHIMDHTPRTRGNHPGIIDYKGKSYCFGQNYDIFRLETSRHAERRSVSVAEMEYNPNGTIRMLPYFHECKLEQIEKFNPYRKVEAETMAWGFGLKTTPKNIWSHERWNQLVTSIDDGEYLMVKGVDFGKAKTFKVSASAHLYGGILEIHIDQKDGPCVGTVNISHTKSELREFTTSVVNLNGVHDLYFVFKGGKELKKNLFMLDWWAFE